MTTQASPQGVSAWASGGREAPFPSLAKADAAQVDVGPRLACSRPGWAPAAWLLSAEPRQRPIRGAPTSLPEESGLDVGPLGSAPARAPGSTAEPQGQARLGASGAWRALLRASRACGSPCRTRPVAVCTCGAPCKPSPWAPLKLWGVSRCDGLGTGPAGTHAGRPHPGGGGRGLGNLRTPCATHAIF